MKFFETSKYYSLKKSTYINLRWIGIVGQLISVNFVFFFLNFEFNFFYSNLIIFIGILSNLYLIYFYKKTQLSDRSAIIFLTIDILQLSLLLFLTGGIKNPFVIFLLIPSVFSSSNLSLRTNSLIVIFTIISIIFLTFYSHDLPKPINKHFHVSQYYYFSIPVALVVALIFLNYFSMTFGTQFRLRKDALAKMEEVMAQEHELLSLGGQAAAAAHSLGTPLSTIKLVTQELTEQFKGQKDVEKDFELLSSQVERCNEILKRLSLNPVEEDNFIDIELSMREYLKEIITSFKEISDKEFIFNYELDDNSKKISKSIEVVYGLRNFIGNANKFSNKKVNINLKSNDEITEILIEDDGHGYSRNVMSKIGEPYLRSNELIKSQPQVWGLGYLLEKPYWKKILQRLILVTLKLVVVQKLL